MFGDPSPQSLLGLAVSDFYRQGGAVAVVVRISADPEPLDPAAYSRALEALRRINLTNLLVVPGELAPETVAAVVAFAEERRAIFVMDPPAAWTSVEAAVAGAGAPAFVRSPNVAMYFPRIRESAHVRAPSGAVAGMIARNDVTRGVWKAPAGVEADLDGVTELELPVDDAGGARLSTLGVNCLRAFPGTGPVVWGAHTTHTSQDWKYVNVRRTALYLEASIERGIRWATFESNEEKLWARLRTEVGSFLDDLCRRGAFAARTPREAYFVRCDADTTTQADVDGGVVNVVVGFAPVRAGQFVVIHFRQAAGQS